MPKNGFLARMFGGLPDESKAEVKEALAEDENQEVEDDEEVEDAPEASGNAGLEAIQSLLQSSFAAFEERLNTIESKLEAKPEAAVEDIQPISAEDLATAASRNYANTLVASKKLVPSQVESVVAVASILGDVVSAAISAGCEEQVTVDWNGEKKDVLGVFWSLVEGDEESAHGWDTSFAQQGENKVLLSPRKTPMKASDGTRIMSQDEIDALMDGNKNKG